jgi:two-component system sensor histidine kinase KdpD
VAAASWLKQETTLKDKRYEYISMLYSQSIRMKNLVINLLDMARLQSGKVRLNKQWQVLEEVVGTSLRTMKEILGKRNVVIDLPVDLPLVEYDAILIDRVLCNLLDNAAKYTSADSKIYISARTNKHDMLISVADDGAGLPKHAEIQIFEKFTRGEKESSNTGVGLGLSICKSIVEAHQGKIWASNKLPQGAIFTFSLPLGTPPALPQIEEH